MHRFTNILLNKQGFYFSIHIFKKKKKSYKRTLSHYTYYTKNLKVEALLGAVPLRIPDLYTYEKQINSDPSNIN